MPSLPGVPAPCQATTRTTPASTPLISDSLTSTTCGSMRSSSIPPEQVGPAEGEPDAVVQRLAEVLDLVEQWL
ncbi:hypothetical protein [Nocardioides sp. GXZ039]|uniref:hypothetical protein n=1 Tax=Nocardioides sp. GXZ039 TaxID=3136018 RepID=UPI0030F3D68A